MICSVLIPTRRRFDGLLRAIDSVFATAATDCVEVLVRADVDDPETLERLPELDRYPRVRSVIGPRLRGYDSLDLFYLELAALAEGDWISIMNDDAWFEDDWSSKDLPDEAVPVISPSPKLSGRSWDRELAALPLTGVVAQPEWTGDGPSKYRYYKGGPFPFVPNKCWDLYKLLPAQPIDIDLDRILVQERGWTTSFLPLLIQHFRDEAFMAARGAGT